MPVTREDSRNCPGQVTYYVRQVKISVTCPMGQVIIFVNRLIDFNSNDKCRVTVAVFVSRFHNSDISFRHLSQHVIGLSKQLSQSEESIHSREQEDDRALFTHGQALASSFVTQAWRKFSHLLYRTNGEKKFFSYLGLSWLLYHTPLLYSSSDLSNRLYCV